MSCNRSRQSVSAHEGSAVLLLAMVVLGAVLPGEPQRRIGAVGSSRVAPPARTSGSAAILPESPRATDPLAPRAHGAGADTTAVVLLPLYEGWGFCPGGSSLWLVGTCRLILRPPDPPLAGPAVARAVVLSLLVLLTVALMWAGLQALDRDREAARASMRLRSAATCEARGTPSPP